MPGRLLKKRYAVLIIFAVLIPVEYYFLFYKPAGNETVRRIILDSNIDIADAAVLEITGLNQPVPFKEISTKNITEKIGEHIALSEIIIEKRWFNTLYIGLKAYNSVAAFIDNKGDTYFVDEKGRIFNTLAANEPMPPLINGLRYSENDRSKMPEVAASLQPFLKDLAFLKKNQKQLFMLIDSINLLENATQHYTTLVSFKNFSNKALWPLRIDERRFYNSVLVLTLLKELNLLANQTIDFRTDEIVYNRAGGPA
jgi:hypothetical protein